MLLRLTSPARTRLRSALVRLWRNERERLAVPRFQEPFVIWSEAALGVLLVSRQYPVMQRRSGHWTLS